MKLGKAIKAARNYLDMSQPELAEAIGMSVQALLNIETGESNPRSSTEKKIFNFFLLNGISFGNEGIIIKDTGIATIDGDNWWLDTLDDVHNSLVNQKEKELLLLCADDAKSSPDTINKYKAMRKDGIQMRQIVEEDNTCLMGYENEYRWMPKEFFVNRVSLIYGNKYVICADDNSKAIVISDAELADTQRQIFEYLWSALKEPTRSTSDVRY
jgi:transcriptional regulator with XRE-family HTH domain